MAYSVFGCFHSFKHRFYVFFRFNIFGYRWAAFNKQTKNEDNKIARGCTITRSHWWWDGRSLTCILSCQTNILSTVSLFSKRDLRVAQTVVSMYVCARCTPYCVILDTVFGHRRQCLFCQFLIFFLHHKFLFDSYSKCECECAFYPAHNLFFHLNIRFCFIFSYIFFILFFGIVPICNVIRLKRNNEIIEWPSCACTCSRIYSKYMFLGHFIHAFYWNFY